VAKLNNSNAFTFIDLFAGIGGIRIPFDRRGGECVFTSEWDKFAAETYRANHGGIVHGDITKVSLQDIPEFDLLLAGFPCQPFSNAGLKRGFDDTRGTLFFNIAEIINFRKPKAVFLENVKGLLSHDRGRTFKEIVRILEDELEYTVSFKVHNAKDFGVPQNRERIFIVALRDGQKFEFETPPYISSKVGEILDSAESVDEKYTLSNKLWESHQRRKRQHLEKGNGFGYSLFNAESPYTSTISARYYKDGSEILIDQENRNPRKLTPREAARLQGFPESFVIPVSDTQAFKQFGNSVSVPAIDSVAAVLAPVLGGTREPADWSPLKFNFDWEV